MEETIDLTKPTEEVVNTPLEFAKNGRIVRVTLSPKNVILKSEVRLEGEPEEKFRETKTIYTGKVLKFQELPKIIDFLIDPKWTRTDGSINSRMKVLEKLKARLHDASPEAKEAFNEVVEHFSSEKAVPGKFGSPLAFYNNWEEVKKDIDLLEAMKDRQPWHEKKLKFLKECLVNK